jgi:catechol 2,3-dioxygenase-like lactoylglutathione lyase family enzyme
MKRLHVHVAVDDLDAAVRFYAGLFGAAPSVTRPDYVKWMLEDPRVNFALSKRGHAPGLDHLGIQVDDEAELVAVEDRLRAAEASVLAQRGATCCYAKSEKSWTYDPQGIAWETFLTTGAADEFGDDTLAAATAGAAAAAGACCP